MTKMFKNKNQFVSLKKYCKKRSFIECFPKNGKEFSKEKPIHPDIEPQKPLESSKIYQIVPVSTQVPPKRPEPRPMALGFVAVSAFIGIRLVSSILENYKKKNTTSFLVEICLVRHGLELDEKIVATRFLPEVDDRIQPFMVFVSFLEEKIRKTIISLREIMVGKIVGIINDAQHLLLVKMFFNEFFEYDSQFNFISSFVCLNDFKNKKNSTRFEKVIKFFSNEKLKKLLNKGTNFINLDKTK